MTGSGEFVSWLRSAASEGERPAEPAATVVLLRDGSGGLETLLVRKNSKIAFGGMWVFPGGRIDDGDRHGTDPHDDVAAAQRAAAREAGEEAGLAVDPATLIPWSFWVPPPQTPRRFATWFFLAPAPPGEVTVDGGEVHAHRWIRPADMIELRDQGEAELAPPTWVTLHTLAGFASCGHAMTAAARQTPERFETRVAAVEEGIAALWHGDAGYEAADGEVEGPRHRLVMSETRWLYERS